MLSLQILVIRRFLLKIVVSALALWVADYLLSGFVVAGGVKGFLIAGLALGTINTFVRPLLKLISFPLILITFGLFTVVINAAILWYVGHWLNFVTISGLSTLLWATFIVSLVQTLLDQSS